MESPKSWNSMGYICLKTEILHLKHYLCLENDIRNMAIFFSRALKIAILMGSFNPYLKKYELKIHRRVICHGNEELCKIWRGTYLSFQSWHAEFDEFWPEHLNVSKIFILMGSFWVKYIFFELKKYRGVIFHETGEGLKIWRGIDLSFQDWHKEFDKF